MTTPTTSTTPTAPTTTPVSKLWANGDLPTAREGGKVYAQGRVVKVEGSTDLYYILAAKPASGVPYVVSIAPDSEHCSCYDWMNKKRFKKVPCKHMWAAFAARVEEIAQGGEG